MAVATSVTRTTPMAIRALSMGQTMLGLTIHICSSVSSVLFVLDIGKVIDHLSLGLGVRRRPASDWR